MSTELFTAKRGGLFLVLILAAAAIFSSGAWVGHRAWAEEGKARTSAVTSKQKPAQKTQRAKSQDNLAKAKPQPRKEARAEPKQAPKVPKPQAVDKQPLPAGKPGRYGTPTIEL